MADLSDTNGNVSLAQLWDMANRVDSWLTKTGSNPNIVYIDIKTKKDYVQFTVFQDMRMRYMKYVTKHGEEPSIIYFKDPNSQTSQQNVSGGWYRSADFEYDGQDTSYWCAPASFSMAMAEQKRKKAESELAKLFGTNTSGTSHSQIRAGMESLGFKVTEVWVKDMDIQRLAEYAANPKAGVIAHIQLKDNSNKKRSMVYDMDGNVIYKFYRDGHYIFNACVNPTRSLILNADPARSMIYVWWEQLWYACRYTEQELGVSGFIVIES